jgi:predicted secreted protein
MADQVDLLVEVNVGGTAEVPLERYATAGYEWHIVQVPPGVADVSISPRPNGGGAPGAATLEHLTLRAIVPGDHQVVLVLRRPWERTPARELRIMVRAR